jgi:predicted DNA-binding transcriptional regulator AlpA
MASASSRPASTASTVATSIDPLLAQVDLCRVLVTSQRTIDRLRASGRLPRPDLHIGRSPRWRPDTIRSWIDQQSHK